MVRPFQPQSIFTIEPAASRTEPSTMIIQDQFQWHRRLSIDSMTRATITAREIANDFLKEKTLQGPWMSPAAHPAIWECASVEGPSPEEIAYNMDCFQAYCNLVIQEADEWHRQRMSGKAGVPMHTERQRECARFMLYKCDWMNNYAVNARKECQYCTSTIAAGAIICPNCNQVVDSAKMSEMKLSQRDKNFIAARQKEALEAEQRGA